jgi:uncharacterized membrane protein YozB (DUF420 family)
MYTVVLAIHNVVRWIVLILILVALVRAYWGWLGKREWSETDRKVGSFLGMAIDTQLLLGLILYIFLSPITRTAFQNFGAAMQVPNVRFFAIEHIFYMLLAVVFVHVGAVLSRRAVDSVAKHKRAALWFSLAFVVILVGMPWTRPLLPGLG